MEVVRRNHESKYFKISRQSRVNSLQIQNIRKPILYIPYNNMQTIHLFNSSHYLTLTMSKDVKSRKELKSTNILLAFFLVFSTV